MCCLLTYMLKTWTVWWFGWLLKQMCVLRKGREKLAQLISLSFVRFLFFFFFSPFTSLVSAWNVHTPFSAFSRAIPLILLLEMVSRNNTASLWLSTFYYLFFFKRLFIHCSTELTLYFSVIQLVCSITFVVSMSFPNKINLYTTVSLRFPPPLE